MSMEEALRRQLVELELALLRPGLRASRERLDALIADDFQEIGAGGRMFGKQDVLGRLPGEQGVVFEAGDFQARLLAPDVALLVYRAVRGDATGSAVSLRSSIWRRDAAGWRMAFHQGTPLPGG